MSEAYGEAAIETVGLHGDDGSKATAYSPTPHDVADRKLRIGNMPSYRDSTMPLARDLALLVEAHVLVNLGTTKAPKWHKVKETEVEEAK
ncbi:hypothetical protein ColLi_12871 [Colletotrichum liriopes]|uniref:Uncharacterized protein n=1 Tax=Colletotrichum liriopes TaxID=708192 RepID=A0AA37GZ62_9PEZI|nr:hypothetical protein ColLi_12871 [Colletotrichum liriopes]